jgi:hypothetical protein
MNQKEQVTRTPEQITDYAPTHPRPLLVEANVVAYFGDFLLGIRKAVKRCSSGLGKSGRIAPTSIASARDRS